eukprot:13436774-Ditylum_brightwellii.AAC.1
MHFKFIKKNLRLSDYSILTADKAQDRLWKARDNIVAVRNHYKQFMPRCCGEAFIDEARIPCNCRAPCTQVIGSIQLKKTGHFGVVLASKLVSALTSTLTMIAYV